MLNRPWLLVLTAALAACSRPATEPVAEPAPATVAAAAETAPTAQDGANGVAIWVHPEDGAKSLILGAGGTGGLEVYGLDGALQAADWRHRGLPRHLAPRLRAGRSRSAARAGLRPDALGADRLHHRCRGRRDAPAGRTACRWTTS